MPCMHFYSHHIDGWTLILRFNSDATCELSAAEDATAFTSGPAIRGDFDCLLDLKAMGLTALAAGSTPVEIQALFTVVIDQFITDAETAYLIAEGM